MGCAFIGITQESKSANNHLDISKWEYKINQISNIRSDKFINSDLWDLISLEFKPKYPMHLIINTNILDRYNSLFRFLFLLKRTQYELQNIWLYTR